MAELYLISFCASMIALTTSVIVISLHCVSPSQVGVVASTHSVSPS